MSKMIKKINYSTTVPAGGHWSLRVRRGSCIRLTDSEGGANVGMLFYNPENLLERYNAPDTLKCQHTFKLTTGNCLYSDMGRVFASIVDDTVGWHETVCGNSHPEHIALRWGKRDYQQDSNQWHQNGHDAFLVELAKYGLTREDLAANVNWFSCVKTDAQGNMKLDQQNNQAGGQVVLRFEMDTLVVLHNCPHPLNDSASYPVQSVQVELGEAMPVEVNDFCKNSCEENKRGFQNNALYHLEPVCIGEAC
jgi:urea carboxylase-associated protein 2